MTETVAQFDWVSAVRATYTDALFRQLRIDAEDAVARVMAIAEQAVPVRTMFDLIVVNPQQFMVRRLGARPAEIMFGRRAMGSVVIGSDGQSEPIMTLQSKVMDDGTTAIVVTTTESDGQVEQHREVAHSWQVVREILEPLVRDVLLAP